MSILNLIIAIVALIIAVLAYIRSGGIKDLRKTTASMLSKMEGVVSTEGETSKGEKGETKK
ncbi:MAG: hypothetical protein U9R17_06265 [Thermodesulfobacteriota bacterium]|nr:hypothetical protein [Thermodesulfobacteriota bacterium]